MLVKKLEKTDWLLIVFSIVGSCVFGYALWNESLVLRYFISQKVGTKKIGEIVSSSNDVRRRMSRSLTWYDADARENLYEKDSIFTGDTSEVEILLLGQQTFRLGSNSMVVLRTDGDDVLLDLQLGSFSGNSNGAQPFKIMQNGVVASVFTKSKSGAIHFAKNDAGDIEMQSGANEFEVQMRSQSEKASGREVIRIKNQEINKETLPIKLMNFEAVQWVSPGQPIRFAWVGEETIASYNLKISRDRLMRESLAEKNIESSEQQANVSDLKREGEYYWRVSSKENPEIKSAIGHFARMVKKPIVLLFPTQQLTFQKKNIRFRWEVRPTLREYRFQLSRDEAMTQIIQERIVASGRTSLSVQPGEYYWRVKAPLPSGELLESPIYSFIIQDPDDALPVAAVAPGADPGMTAAPGAPLATPKAKAIAAKKTSPAELSREELLKMKVADAPDKIVLAQPKQVITLNAKRGVNLRNLASVYDGLAKVPELEWEASGAAQFYQLELSADPDVSQPIILEAEGDKLSAKWKEPLPGDYYYKVIAYGTKEGNLASQIGEVRVQLPKVNVKPNYNEVVEVEDPAQLDVADKDFSFSWQAHPLADGYSFKVKDEFGNKIFQKNVKQTNFSYKPSELGKYAVEVAPLFNNKNAGPKDLSSLNYEKKLITRQPAAILPMTGATIVVFGSAKSSPVLFEWTEVPYAKGYELQLSKDKTFASILGKQNVTKPNSVVKGIKATGRIYWRVRSRYTDNIYSAWSKADYFDQQASK